MKGESAKRAIELGFMQARLKQEDDSGGDQDEQNRRQHHDNRRNAEQIFESGP